MRSGLKISTFLQLVASAALLLLAWRGLEFVSAGGLQNPLWRGASAQEATANDGDTMEASAADKMETEKGAEGVDPMPNPDKRMTATQVMEMRASDVSETFGSDGQLLESERNVLTRLAERRKQIEKFEQELAVRERLIEVAENRIESRIAELKAIEQRLQAQAKEEGEDVPDGLSNIVVMYEAMKPKDAARIFNTLDLGVLVSVVEQMKPRTMSAVLAAMDPMAAQNLTLKLAGRSAMRKSEVENELGSIGNDG